MHRPRIERGLPDPEGFEQIGIVLADSGGVPLGPGQGHAPANRTYGADTIDIRAARGGWRV